MRKSLWAVPAIALLACALPPHANSQKVTNLSLTSTTTSKCDFARAVTPDGRRILRINLKPANSYSYGEVYGQLFFDFRRNGTAQAPQTWFSGFREALLGTGLFSEEREYVFAVGAYANLPDATGTMKRVELGKQILYNFKTGPGGNLQLITQSIQAGDRRIISSVEREGIFTLSPRLEIVQNTNTAELEFEFYQSKQTKVEVGILSKIIGAIASVLTLGGAITVPQQQAAAAVIESATKPIQEVAKLLSEHFEPITTMKKVKSVGFLPGIAIDLNNVASYSADIQDGAKILSYEVRVYAAVIPSIISNQLDGDCRYPQYSGDANSMLRAAVTPSNVSIEQYYKDDNVRRTFLAQMGKQASKSDLVEVCNTLKEDLRRYFGGFDVYAISWAIFASRETSFNDKVAARDCFTPTEKKIIYERLGLPKLFGE